VKLKTIKISGYNTHVHRIETELPKKALGREHSARRD